MSSRLPGQLVMLDTPVSAIDADGWPCLVLGEWHHRVTGAVIGRAVVRSSLTSTQLRAPSGSPGLHLGPAAPAHTEREEV